MEYLHSERTDTDAERTWKKSLDPEGFKPRTFLLRGGSASIPFLLLNCSAFLFKATESSRSPAAATSVSSELNHKANLSQKKKKKPGEGKVWIL